MDSSKREADASSAFTHDLAQSTRQILADIQPLLEAPHPLPQVEQAKLSTILANLTAFKDKHFLTHWQIRLPSPVQAMMLVNGEEDDRPHLITVTTAGNVTRYAPVESNKWQAIAHAALPADAGPPVAIESIYFDYEQIEIPHIVTRGQGDPPGDHLYELVSDQPGQLQFKSRTLRKAVHRLAVAHCAGKTGGDGLTAVIATRETGVPAVLRPTGTRYSLALDITPVALAHTADQIWVADNLERIWRWRWDGRHLYPDADWPAQGLSLDGQITALALWATAGGRWLLLAATDERQLFIIDEDGHHFPPIPTHQMITALVPLQEQGQLFVADENNHLCLIQPVWLPLATTPLPNSATLITLLPEEDREHLLQTWITGSERHAAAVAAHIIAQAILDGDERAAAWLAQVNNQQPLPVLTAIFESLEPLALTQANVQSALVRAVFQMTRTLYLLANIQLRRLIHLYTARLAAHFEENVYEDPDYRWLSKVRRDGEETQTQAYRQQGENAGTLPETITAYQNALDLYGRRLIHRQQVAWLFATNRTIRALAPLPGQQVLVATRAGIIHLLDLKRRRRVAAKGLPCQGIPRTIITGALSRDGAELVAIVTSQGRLYTGLAQGENCLPTIKRAGDLERHIWGAAFVPATIGQSPGLVISSDNGELIFFQQNAAGEWIAQQTIHTNIYRIHALTVKQLSPDQPPLILVGGTGANGGGVLHLISLEGQPRYAPMNFAGPVMDIQTATASESKEKVIAIACRDGFVHLMHPAGSQLWTYQTGRAARALAVGDMDGNGYEEIIVGSEGESHAVLIFDIAGAIRWHIPIETPIVHIVVVPSAADQLPQLLITDLNRTLRVIELTPPGSPQEKRLVTEADACCRQLAHAQGITDAELILRWLDRPPTDALQGYAYLVCAREVSQGSAMMQERLTHAQLDASPPIIQHALGKALVRATAQADNQTVTAIVAHLAQVAARGQASSPVIVAALRELVLTGLLAESGITLWLPFLKEAARQPDTNVKRATLYGLRDVTITDDTGLNLKPEIWEILQAFVAVEAGFNQSRDDLAALLRDVATNKTALLSIVHQAVITLGDSVLPALLGRSDPPLLDDPQLAQVISALGELQRMSKPVDAKAEFRRLADRFSVIDWEGATDTTDPVLNSYQLLIEGIRLSNYQEWQQFMTAPMAGAGALFAALGAGLEVENGRIIHQIQEIQQACQRMEMVDPTPGEISRLNEKLRRAAERLLRSPETSSSFPQPPHPAQSPLIIGLAGCLWHWANLDDGILTQWLSELSGPTEPFLEVTRVTQRPTELQLDIKIVNPDKVVPFDEFRLKMRQTQVSCNGYTFNCYADPDRPTEEFYLDPQKSVTFRLRVFFNEDERADIDRLFQQEQQAVLQVPVRYLRPPQTWAEPTLKQTFTISPISHTALNYAEELSATWQSVRLELERALNGREYPLIHIKCAPFARDSFFLAINPIASRHTPRLIVDLRRWVFERERFRENPWRVNADALLYWIASQLEPTDTLFSASTSLRVAPRQLFRRIGRTSACPRLIIFNNWDRLLVNLSRRHRNLDGLADTLTFLTEWAAESKIRLVFIGSYLSERIMARIWPQLTANMKAICCNSIDVSNTVARVQLEKTIERILQKRGLVELLRDFPGKPTVPEVVRLCGGFLHFLDTVAIPALNQLKQTPSAHFPPMLKLFVDYAEETNFLSMLWHWQSFAERLALLLVAAGEIPVQEKTWVQSGMILSRAYYARHPSGERVRAVTIPANQRLTPNDVQRIRSNVHFQRGDVWIRGFNPQRPALPEWGDAGTLFVELLRVMDDGQVIAKLVTDGLLHKHHASRLGDYYDIAVPLQKGWLDRTEAWTHLQQSTQEVSLSWYPQKLSLDRRPGLPQQRVLFVDREARSAHADIPLRMLPAIDRALSARTRPLFLNLYGLQGADRTKVESRWNSLVKFSQAINDWGASAGYAGSAEQETVRRLFEGLGELFQFQYQVHPDEERPLGVLPVYFDSTLHPKQAIPWVVAELSSNAQALRKQVLWLVLRDPASIEMPQLHQWAREKVGQLHRKNEADLPETDYIEALERSIVFVLSLAGKQDNERKRPGQGGPHFIFLDADLLADLIVQVNSLKSLISYAYGITGRHCFTPYKLFGSLDGGSDLFVGRGNELQIILSTLDRENHAILGSRRIGKTSLLRKIEYRLRQTRDGHSPLTLLLRLQDRSTHVDFYSQIRWALTDKGYHEIARRLADPPHPGYEDLREVMYQLSQQTNHPVILLMDEVDGLYFWDRGKNEERLFQFLRNNLAQSTPRLCTLIMTGFRHIYLNRLAHSSVFYNFCRFHNLAGVEPEAIKHLVYLLKGFNIEFDDGSDVINLLAAGTYAIPYYAQRVCDRLLQSADRKQDNSQNRMIRIGPADVQAVLEGDIQVLLKQELWNELNVDPVLNMTEDGKSRDAQLQTRKLKAVLLATILTRYEHLAQAEYTLPLFDTRPPVFTTADALTYLEEFYPRQSVITESELERLFQSLTMTLALAPAEEARWAYYFPNNILPHVLFFHEHHGRTDLINELADLMQELQTK